MTASLRSLSRRRPAPWPLWTSTGYSGTPLAVTERNSDTVSGTPASPRTTSPPAAPVASQSAARTDGTATPGTTSSAMACHATPAAPMRVGKLLAPAARHVGGQVGCGAFLRFLSRAVGVRTAVVPPGDCQFSRAVSTPARFQSATRGLAILALCDSWNSIGRSLSPARLSLPRLAAAQRLLLHRRLHILHFFFSGYERLLHSRLAPSLTYATWTDALAFFPLPPSRAPYGTICISLCALYTSISPHPFRLPRRSDFSNDAGHRAPLRIDTDVRHFPSLRHYGARRSPRRRQNLPSFSALDDCPLLAPLPGSSHSLSSALLLWHNNLEPALCCLHSETPAFQPAISHDFQTLRHASREGRG